LLLPADFSFSCPRVLPTSSTAVVQAISFNCFSLHAFMHLRQCVCTGPATGSPGQWTAQVLDKCCPKCAGDRVDDVGTGSNVSRLREYFTIFISDNTKYNCRLFNTARLFSPSRKILGAPESVYLFSFESLFCVCVCVGCVGVTSSYWKMWDLVIKTTRAILS